MSNHGSDTMPLLPLSRPILHLKMIWILSHLSLRSTFVIHSSIKNLSPVTYNLESINSADYGDTLSDIMLDDSSTDIEFVPFIMPHSKHAIFADDLSTSSFLKDDIVRNMT